MSSVSCFSMGFYFALVQSLYLYESRSAFVWVTENKRFFLYLVGSLWFDEFSRRIERHHVLTSGQTQDHVGLRRIMVYLRNYLRLEGKAVFLWSSDWC